MGMYIHIPFCVKKCNYCDFLSAPATQEIRGRYVDALCEELKESADQWQKKEVATIFFGGGTPSVLAIEQTGKIMETIRNHYRIADGAEITTEANPGTLDAEKLRAYREFGFNRLSMGLQSADRHELEVLGRIHTYEEFFREYEAARGAGFANINVDLMCAVPDQTLESWHQTLHRVAHLAPEHISAYSLIIEEGTPFWEMSDRGDFAGRLVDEDTERRMYHDTKRILKEYGYERYEISNYAKAGLVCRHNLAYWERADYAGFGIGAASLAGNMRYRNTDKLGDYLQNASRPETLRTEREILSKNDGMAEFMFLGLRKTAGVSRREFYENFQVELETVYAKSLQRLQQKKLLVCENDRIFLTELGLDVSNMAMAEFLLEEDEKQ